MSIEVVFETVFVPMSVDALTVSEPALNTTWADLTKDQPFVNRDARRAGVYLRWALPSALAHQATVQGNDGAISETQRLVPDRWAVYRLWFPPKAAQGSVRAWVIDSLEARCVALDAWDGHLPTDNTRLTAFGVATRLADDTLEFPAGDPDPAFAAYYDRCAGRLTFYDNLDPADLGGATTVTYVVAGWYGDATDDVLHALSWRGLLDRCEELDWTVPVVLPPPPPIGTMLSPLHAWAAARKADVHAAPPAEIVQFCTVVHGTIADVQVPARLELPPGKPMLVAQPPAVAPAAILSSSPDAALFAALSADDLGKQRVYRAWLQHARDSEAAESLLHDDEIVPAVDDAPALKQIRLRNGPPKEVAVPAPRWWVPRDPVVALTSVIRSYVHGYEGRFDVNGLLKVRGQVELVESSATVPDPKKLVAGIAAPSKAPPGIDALVYETVVISKTAIAAAAKATTGGPPVSPVGYVEWSQPWIPLAVDWHGVVASSRPGDWGAGDLDYVAPIAFRQTLGSAGNGEASVKRRSMLSIGSLAHLVDALKRLPEELAVDDATLDRAQSADITLVSLPGLRDALGPGGFVAGACSLAELRVVDAFGQTQLVAAGSQATVALEDEVDGAAGWCSLPPRFYTANAPPTAQGARLDFSWTSAADDGGANPVCGLVMVNHLDESLMAWEADGTPLGQIRTRIVAPGQGADEIVWELEPGTDGPMGARPRSANKHFSRALDAVFDATRDTPGQAENALAAVLRTIDTTSWSKDPLGVGASAHLAVLVGRPLVWVRATVAVYVRDEATQNALRDAGTKVALRLGDIARLDDGVLAYFAGDDYTRLHAIESSMLAAAMPGSLGTAFAPTGHTKLYDALVNESAIPYAAITHPFIVAPTIDLAIGVPMPLTLLMDPRGRVHPTSGPFRTLPVDLERDDFDPVISKLQLSFRFGPLIGNVDDVRMPLPAQIEGRWDWVQRVDPTHWAGPLPVTGTSGSPQFDPRTARAREGYLVLSPQPGASDPTSHGRSFKDIG